MKQDYQNLLDDLLEQRAIVDEGIKAITLIIQREKHSTSVLFIHDQCGAWVAQCLEYDIAAQGPTIEEAGRALHQTFLGQIALDIDHNKQPLEDIGPAPSEYHELAGLQL